jgi:molybdopterin/thiamine biosynthesis adenylyltransferase
MLLMLQTFIGILESKLSVLICFFLKSQTIHTTLMIGVNKAISAATRLLELNPMIKCTPYPFKIDQTNVLEFAQSYIITICCCDRQCCCPLSSE